MVEIKDGPNLDTYDVTSSSVRNLISMMTICNWDVSNVTDMNGYKNWPQVFRCFTPGNIGEWVSYGYLITEMSFSADVNWDFVV